MLIRNNNDIDSTHMFKDQDDHLELVLKAYTGGTGKWFRRLGGGVVGSAVLWRLYLERDVPKLLGSVVPKTNRTTTTSEGMLNWFKCLCTVVIAYRSASVTALP